MKQIQSVLVYQGVIHRTFHSDNLVFKRVSNVKTPYNEILSFTMIGYTADVKDFLKKNSRLSISHKDEYTNDSDRFIIRDLDDYEIQQIKSGDFTKVIFARKVDSIIKQQVDDEEEQKTPAYPLLILTKENEDQQKTYVYNMVKNGITTPMFPNVEEHLILAGQLFIDKKEAKTVLDVLNGESKEIIDLKLLNRAKFLIQAFQGWKDFIFERMKEEGLIRPVRVRYSKEEMKIFEVIIEENKIEQIIQDGIKRRDIIFTPKSLYADEIKDFNEFMTVFAEAMAKRIDSLAKPLHRRGELREDTKYWFNFLKRKPLSAQKDAIEASLKSLQLKGKVNVIGECGVGKTFVMLSTQWILSRLEGFPMKLLVFCPDTLVDTVWQEEIQETLHDCQVHKVRSITDLEEFDKLGYFDDKEDRAFILSQHVAKSGYTLKPAVNWGVIPKKDPKSERVVGRTFGFMCPCCGEPVTEFIKNETNVLTEPKFIEVPVKFNHFKTQRYNNYRCKSCDEVLWEPLNKDSAVDGKFVYSGELKGFFPKDTRPVRKVLEEMVKAHGATGDKKTKARLDREIKQYRYLEMTIQGKHAQGRRISPKKVSVAEYIFKKMRNRFTNLIIDEFHEFQGDSSRSDACVQLINSIPYIQTGTGTGMNGYAYSRFKTDYMMYPEKMKAAGFKITDKEKYQATFGVTEKRFRLKKEDGKTKRHTLAPVARPGISPVIFPLFMQDTTVFLSLEDLKDDLPELRHYQIEVEMDEELKKAKEELEKEIKSVARYDKKLFRGSIQVGYSYLDSPTIEKELVDRDTKETILKTPVVSSHKDNKLKELRKLIRNEVELEGNKVMVYTYFTGDNINKYLWDNISRDGYKVTVLNKQEEESVSCDGTTKKIQKADREKFIREESAKGTEVLIVNPELIKTGYNLTDFPTICYYQMGYQVYTNRQADRRAWRLGQTKDCKIIYIYYKDSIQQDVASLMATKIVASQAIEGKMDAAGLEAICNDRTAEEELAQKFFEGIRGKVTLKGYDKETA